MEIGYVLCMIYDHDGGGGLYVQIYIADTIGNIVIFFLCRHFHTGLGFNITFFRVINMIFIVFLRYSRHLVRLVLKRHTFNL